MFMFRWMRVAVFSLPLLLLALSVSAGGSYSTYDPMEGDYARPSRRDTPKRDFAREHRERESRTFYAPRTGEGMRAARRAPRESLLDRGSSSRTVSPQEQPYEPYVNRVEPDRDGSTRYVQPEGDAPPITLTTTGETSGAALVQDGEERTEENSQEVAADTKPDPKVLREERANRIVYCSRRLYEYHLRPDCPYLAGVNPTPMMLKEAQERSYTACPRCRKGR